MNIGIYPGTFDPVTFGHLDIMERAAKMFSQLIVGVAAISGKNTWFSLEERVAMIQESIGNDDRFDNVVVRPMQGLLVDFARIEGAIAIIRGLRAVSDFEYELAMALLNRKLNKDVETVFFMPQEQFIYLSSSFVRQLAAAKAPLAQFVPKPVAEAFRLKHLP